MSLNLTYSFKEGWFGLRRAKLASVITISTIAFTLFLLSLVTLLSVNIQRIVETFKNRMSIEVFIDNSQTQEQVNELKNRLMLIPGVQEAVFISKENALQKFREEFGEDPLSLLGENPLPPSFHVLLKPTYRVPAKTDSIANQIRRHAGVDEVVYHGRLFKTVDQWSRIILLIDLGLLLIVLVASLFLIANTLRLSLLTQSKNIQIMHLVGATKGFIQRPYWVQGIIEGGLGGAIATFILWIVLRGIIFQFSLHLQGIRTIVLMPFVLGVFLGFLGSTIGLARFLRA